MSDTLRSPKIKPWHLDRIAIVYIRQSDPQQPVKHPESTARQYALVDRAVALGWPRERVKIIDEDQGTSASTAEGRPGFHYLMAEVALDHVGLMQCLARRAADRQRRRGQRRGVEVTRPRRADLRRRRAQQLLDQPRHRRGQRGVCM